MNLKEQMIEDLSIFYDVDAFGTSAFFNNKDITIIFLDYEEVNNTKEKIISAITSDVIDISVGDIINIESIDFEVINFDYKDNTQIETLIAIKEA